MRVNIFSCLLALVLGCNVTAEILPKVVREKVEATLRCPGSVEGNVTWSRERDGNRVDILTADGDGETKHIHDPDNRYSSNADKSLLIVSVTISDAGSYFCNNEPAVRLSVIPGQKTKTKSTPPTTRNTLLANTGTSTQSPKSDQPSTTYHKPLLGLVFGIAATFVLLLITITIIIFTAGRGRSRRESEGKPPVYEEIQDELVDRGKPTNGGGNLMTTFAETSQTNASPYSLVGIPEPVGDHRFI